MTTPCVGIFWGIRDKARGTALLADKTPIDGGEAYGDCIAHPTGHYEFWEGLSAMGAAALMSRGLPTAPAWHEYEEFPRGRIVYWPKNRRFIVYADRRLQTKDFIERLVVEFDIPNGSYAVRTDPHYRSSASEL